MPSGGTSSPPSTRRSVLPPGAAGHPYTRERGFSPEHMPRAGLVRHRACGGVGRSPGLGVSGPGLRVTDMAQCGRKRPVAMGSARPAHGGEPDGGAGQAQADRRGRYRPDDGRGPAGGFPADWPAVHGRHGTRPGARHSGRRRPLGSSRRSMRRSAERGHGLQLREVSRPEPVVAARLAHG